MTRREIEPPRRPGPVVAAVDADAVMPALLTALDDAGPLAANYLRAAIDAVAERTDRKAKLPHDQLQRFFARHLPRPSSRRLAFEWLAKIDPAAARPADPRLLERSELGVASRGRGPSVAGGTETP